MGPRKIRSEVHKIWRSNYLLKLWLLVAGPEGATERLKGCRREAGDRAHKLGRERETEKEGEK